MLLERNALCRMSRWGVARPRDANRPHQHHQHRTSGQLQLIMTIGPLPDVVKLGFHCVRTHWIRGFIAFQLVRRIQTVMLTVSV